MSNIWKCLNCGAKNESQFLCSACGSKEVQELALETPYFRIFLWAFLAALLSVSIMVFSGTIRGFG
jgi:hypothetical protein